MIRITRDGGLIHMDELTQEQYETAIVAMFRHFLQEHPEEITGGQDAAEDSTIPA